MRSVVRLRRLDKADFQEQEAACTPVNAASSLEEIEIELRRRFPDLLASLGIKYELRGDRFWMLSPLRKDPNWTSFCFGQFSGIWKDFTADVAGKGALSFVCQFATEGRWKSEKDNSGVIVRAGAVQWAIDFLGWSNRAPDPAKAKAAREALDRADEQAAKRMEANRSKAKGLWLAGRDLDGTDPVSCYLLARGIDPKALPDGWPRALRFHPEVWAQDDDKAMRGPHPAMLAAISDERITSGFAALHRTYLAESGGEWGKLTWPGCKTGKQVKGAYAGASIRLTNGASKKPLRSAKPEEWALIGEGIEDALTGAMAQPAIRALAAVSISNIGGSLFPGQVGRRVHPEAERHRADGDPAVRSRHGSAGRAGHRARGYRNAGGLQRRKRCAARPAEGGRMSKREILRKATKAVAARGKNYGDVRENFERIARRWRAHLQNRFGMEVPIDAYSVALMMDDMKSARLENDPRHEDSWVDKAGYAACGGEIAKRGRA
jgi:hypothetical protein